jgi:hypothetical protein
MLKIQKYTQLNNGGRTVFLFRYLVLIGLLKWILIPTVCRAGGEELLHEASLERQRPHYVKCLCGINPERVKWGRLSG